MGKYRVSVDTGGTFTDFVFYEEVSKSFSITKVPSTPEDPSRAILAGIQELLGRGVQPSEIVFFSHGTTVGTNALLEGKGVRTGLLVTEGFRGIYEVQEQARPYGPPVFDVMYDRPPLLVPSYLTGEVPERIGSEGEELRPLDVERTRVLVDLLKERKVEAIAVCFLFSFLNPEHERAVADIIRSRHPACAVSLSSEVLPQIREYLRLSTTVINATIQPILARYMEKLDERLRTTGVTTAQKYIMQSNGGVTTVPKAPERAVTTVLSGPAGGVIAGVEIGRQSGFPDLITLDIGGTSCDVALIQGGVPALRTQGEMEGRHIAVPMLDIHTLSAGGGTMARVDSVGVLHVGPESAGAVPGPVCYGQGGEHPTITDANLLLGYLNPENFLGGRMSLRKDLAAAAMKKKIADPLSMDVLAAAEGIIRIVNVKMEEGIKSISSKRGYDLREFTLMAFGGAGPLHGARMAVDLGIPRVLVPPHPGVTSALGLLMAPVRHDYVRSRLSLLLSLAPEEINRTFEALSREARRDLTEEGFGERETALELGLDLRYSGQSYEVTIPLDEFPVRAEILPRVRSRFDEMHEKLFGHRAEGEEVEVVNYRVVGVGLVPRVELPCKQAQGIPLSRAQRGERAVTYGPPWGTVPCPIYDRQALDVECAIPGPAIIEQLDTTVVILPDQKAKVDPYGNLIIETS